MKKRDILPIVEGIPHTIPERGVQLYDFILQHRATRCLELGFAHGVGAVWMAAAIEELGGGTLIGVDNLSALDRTPLASQLIKKASLESIVQLHFDPVSYTWHLQRNLRDYCVNQFDFIFLDGAHTWDVDGFTFFLCERILKPGGWILFDDLDWNYRGSAAAMAQKRIQDLTDEEKDLEQVRTVWNELVLPHPNFSTFRDDDGWGWAQKSQTDDTPRTLSVTHSQSLANRFLRRVGLA